jgi:hypothetical protein
MFLPQFWSSSGLKKTLSSNQTHWIQYGSVFVNRLLSSEYVKGIYYKITIMIKRRKDYLQNYKYDKNV